MKEQHEIESVKPDLIEIFEWIKNGNKAIIIPLFLATDIDIYAEIVLKWVESSLQTKTQKRIYLIMQQGISKQKCQKLWDNIAKKGDHFNKHDNSEKLQVYSFGNIPLDVMRYLLDTVETNGKVIIET